MPAPRHPPARPRACRIILPSTFYLLPSLPLPALLRRALLFILPSTFYLLPSPSAPAHVTLEFHATPTFQANPMFLGQPPPAVVHAIITAHLGPDSLEIQLRLADTAAYNLLTPDPFPSPANSTTTSSSSSPSGPSIPSVSSFPSSSSSPNAHFTADQPLLARLAPTLFTLTANGTPLELLSATVTLTPDLDVLFTLTYPRPPPGTLHLQANDFNQVPPNQNDVITVSTTNGQTLLSTDLNAAHPALDIPIPQPSALAPPPLHRTYALVITLTLLALAALAILAWRLLRHAPTQ